MKYNPKNNTEGMEKTFDWKKINKGENGFNLSLNRTYIKNYSLVTRGVTNERSQLGTLQAVGYIGVRSSTKAHQHATN